MTIRRIPSNDPDAIRARLKYEKAEADLLRTDGASPPGAVRKAQQAYKEMELADKLGHERDDAKRKEVAMLDKLLGRSLRVEHRAAAKELQSKNNSDPWDFVWITLFWYFVIGLLFLLPHWRDEPILWMPWWLAYALSPVILTVGLAAVAAGSFALFAMFFYSKKWLYDPFPNFWNATIGCLKTAISSPFEFLEEEARKADLKKDYRKSAFYRKFLEILAWVFLLTALGFIVAVMNFFGCEGSHD